MSETANTKFEIQRIRQLLEEILKELRSAVR